MNITLDTKRTLKRFNFIPFFFKIVSYQNNMCLFIFYLKIRIAKTKTETELFSLLTPTMAGLCQAKTKSQ